MTNVSTHTFFFFVVGAVLFFYVSFSKQIWKTIISNLVFLVVLYVGIGDILGDAKPIYNIPFYNHASWDDSGVYVVGGYWNDTDIYLLVKEDQVRLYRWPMNPEFLAEIKKAQKKKEEDTGDRWNFKIFDLGAARNPAGLDFWGQKHTFYVEHKPPPKKSEDSDLKRTPPSGMSYVPYGGYTPGSSEIDNTPKDFQIK